MVERGRLFTKRRMTVSDTSREIAFYFREITLIIRSVDKIPEWDEDCEPKSTRAESI